MFGAISQLPHLVCQLPWQVNNDRHTFLQNLGQLLKLQLQTIFFVKTSNDFILPIAKGLRLNLFFCKNGNKFLMEGMMGCILVLTKQFIPNNSNKCIMKSHNSSSKNPLKLCFVCELCSVTKQIFDRKIHQIRFCFYIVKGWRESPINIILFLEEPLGKNISIYHVIR